jgi:hypothetical protein
MALNSTVPALVLELQSLTNQIFPATELFLLFLEMALTGAHQFLVTFPVGVVAMVRQGQMEQRVRPLYQQAAEAVALDIVVVLLEFLQAEPVEKEDVFLEAAAEEEPLRITVMQRVVLVEIMEAPAEVAQVAEECLAVQPAQGILAALFGLLLVAI